MSNCLTILASQYTLTALKVINGTPDTNLTPDDLYGY